MILVGILLNRCLLARKNLQRLLMAMICITYRSKIIRINGLFTNKLWSIFKQDSDFLAYFPDKFKKYPPPKSYFWRVLSQARPEKFKNIMQIALKDYKHLKKLNNQNIKMTNEALDAFDAFVKESLSLLGTLTS